MIFNINTALRADSVCDVLYMYVLLPHVHVPHMYMYHMYMSCTHAHVHVNLIQLNQLCPADTLLFISPSIFGVRTNPWRISFTSSSDVLPYPFWTCSAIRHRDHLFALYCFFLRTRLLWAKIFFWSKTLRAGSRTRLFSITLVAGPSMWTFVARRSYRHPNP